MKRFATFLFINCLRVRFYRRSSSMHRSFATTTSTGNQSSLINPPGRRHPATFHDARVEHRSRSPAFTPHADMHTHDAIVQRRAVKQYDPEHVMPDADANKLIELATLSPTAFNIQHWRIVNVTDRDLRQKIRAVAWDQA